MMSGAAVSQEPSSGSELVLNEESIQQLRIKSRLENLILIVSAANSVLAPILFFNAIPHFFQELNDISAAQNAIQYYTCNVPPESLDAAVKDGATVSTEAFGISMPIVVNSLGVSAFIICYQLLKYGVNRRHINDLIFLLKENGFHNPGSVRYLDLCQKQLLELIDLLIDQDISHDLVIAILKTRLSKILESESRDLIALMHENNIQHAVMTRINMTPPTWRRFAEATVWYRAQLSKYMIPLAMIAAVPGLVDMFIKADTLSDKVGCDIWTLINDKCKPSGQYSMMALLNGPWISISFTLLGFNALGMLSRLLLTPFKNCRTRFYDKTHKAVERWYDDADKWLINKLAWEILSIPLMPAIVIYSAFTAIKTVNEYALEENCESLWVALSNLIETSFSGEENNTSCARAQLSMLLSGLIGDLEVGKLYFLYASAKTGNFLLSLMLERFSYFYQENIRGNAKKLLQRFTDINDISWKVGFFQALIVSPFVAFIAKSFADTILQKEGITSKSTIDDMIRPLNITFPIDNATLARVLNEICPYDKIDLSRFNITYPINITLPEEITNYFNQSINFPLVAPCPEYNIASLFFRKLFSMPIDCNAVLNVRGIAAFIGLFWVAIGAVLGVGYLSASEILLAAWGLQSLMGSLRSQEHPALPNENQMRLLASQRDEINEDDEQDKKSQTGCLSRLYCRFFNNTSNAVAQNNVMPLDSLRYAMPS